MSTATRIAVCPQCGLHRMILDTATVMSPPRYRMTCPDCDYQTAWCESMREAAELWRWQPLEQAAPE